MFAFVVFDLVFQYLSKRLAGKNFSKMTCLCRLGFKTNSVKLSKKGRCLLYATPQHQYPDVFHVLKFCLVI